MAVTPSFHFAAQASRLKYAIASSASVTATGDSITGVGSSTWSIVGTAGSLIADWVLSSPTLHTVVVTAPAGADKAAILQRVVVSGTGRYVSTAKLYSGTETVCTNETDESDAVAGWAPLVNVAILGGGGGGALPDAAFTGQVSLTSSARSEFDDGASECVLGLPTQPYTPGAEYELTIVDASDLIYPSALDPLGEWGAFVPPYFIAVTATSGSTFISVGKAQTAPGTATPTISSLSVDASDLDKLIIPASVACQFPAGALTGASLGGTMAIPRTLTAVVSGNGTNSITLDLSGDLDVADTATFILASDRELCSMESGVKVAAGSYGITITGGDYAWAASVTGETLDLISSAGLGGSPADGATFSPWTSQVGSWAFAEATNRPTYRATEINGHPAVDFDGTNDILTSSTMTVANLVGAGSTAFEIIAAVEADTISATGSGYNVANPIIADASGYIGMFVYLNGGTTYRAVGYVYTSTSVVAEVDIGASIPVEGMVIEMRWTGTALTMSYNGTDGTPNSTVGTGVLNAGASAALIKIGAGAGSAFFDGKIGRIVAKAGSGTKETAAIAAFVSKYV